MEEFPQELDDLGNIIFSPLDAKPGMLIAVRRVSLFLDTIADVDVCQLVFGDLERLLRCLAWSGRWLRSSISPKLGSTFRTSAETFTASVWGPMRQRLSSF